MLNADIYLSHRSFLAFIWKMLASPPKSPDNARLLLVTMMEKIRPLWLEKLQLNLEDSNLFLTHFCFPHDNDIKVTGRVLKNTAAFTHILLSLPFDIKSATGYCSYNDESSRTKDQQNIIDLWASLVECIKMPSLYKLCVKKIREAIFPITPQKLEMLGLPKLLQKSVSGEDVAEKVFECIMECHGLNQDLVHNR